MLIRLEQQNAKPLVKWQDLLADSVPASNSLDPPGLDPGNTSHDGNSYLTVD